RRVGLHADGVRPSELVEVVDVQAAQVDLHRLEYFGDGDAELPRARAVQIHPELRDVDLVAGEDTRELRRLVRLHREVLDRGAERLVAERTAIFDLQLEAAGR